MPFKKGEIPKGAKLFKKGESGNPAGYPKGQPNRSTAAKRILAISRTASNDITDELEKLSQEEIITIRMAIEAENGNVNAYKALMDSAYGSPVQQIEQTTIDMNLPEWLKDGESES
tara:strand:- start:2754 stop:3101 length:348 start_codon:yes stop_codon:yes gene_type:complete